jgi:hypothetical protein
MNEVLDMVMPERVRKILEEAIGQKLPEDMTFLRGHIFNELLASYGINTGFRLDVSKDIRATVQGQDAQPIEVTQTPLEPEGSLADRVYAHLVETAYKRGKLYNMEMPELEQLAADQGFQLPDAADDKQLTEGVKK